MYSFLFTSLDTMLAAFGLSLLSPASINRRLLCSAFLLADAAASVCGLLLSHSPAAAYALRFLTPGAAAAYLLFASALTYTASGNTWATRISIPVLALLLSGDNFVAAALGGETLGISGSVLLPSLASGCGALFGIQAARLLPGRINRNWLLWAGAACTAAPMVIR